METPDKKLEYVSVHFSDEEETKDDPSPFETEDDTHKLFTSLKEINEMCGQINSAENDHDISDVKREIAQVTIDKATFTCKLCHIKPFKSQQQVEAHLMYAHDLGEQTALFTHIKTPKKKRRAWRKEKDGYFHCFFCHHRSRRSINVKDHEKKVHPGEEIPVKNYLCKLCKRRFSIQEIFEHVQSEHKEQSDSAGFVGNNLAEHYSVNFMQTNKQGNLSDSQESIEALELRTDGSYQCGKCNFLCKDIQSFTEHFKNHNDSEGQGQNFKYCEQCSYKTKSDNGLRLHERMHHAQIKNKKGPNSCNICGETRTRNAIHICQKKNMKKKRGKQRELVRDQDGNFLCANCDYRNKNYQTITSHVRSKNHAIQRIEPIVRKTGENEPDSSEEKSPLKFTLRKVKRSTKESSNSINGDSGKFIIERDIANKGVVMDSEMYDTETEAENQEKDETAWEKGDDLEPSPYDSFDSGPDGGRGDDSDDDWTPTNLKKSRSKTDSSTDSSEKGMKKKRRRQSQPVVDKAKKQRMDSMIDQNDSSARSPFLRPSQENPIAAPGENTDGQGIEGQSSIEQNKDGQGNSLDVEKDSQNKSDNVNDGNKEATEAVNQEMDTPLTLTSKEPPQGSNSTTTASETATTPTETASTTGESPTPIVIQPPISIEPTNSSNSDTTNNPSQQEATSPGDCVVTDYTEARIRNRNQPDNVVPFNIAPIMGMETPRPMMPGMEGPRPFIPRMGQGMSLPRMAAGHAMFRMDMNPPIPRMAMGIPGVNPQLQAMAQQLNGMGNIRQSTTSTHTNQAINIEPQSPMPSQAAMGIPPTSGQITPQSANKDPGQVDPVSAIQNQASRILQQSSPLMTSSPRRDSDGRMGSPAAGSGNASGGSTPQRRESQGPSTPSSPRNAAGTPNSTSAAEPSNMPSTPTSLTLQPQPSDESNLSLQNNLTPGSTAATSDLVGITPVTNGTSSTSTTTSQPMPVMMTPNVAALGASTPPTTAATATPAATPQAKATTTDTGKTIGDLFKCILCRVYFEDQAMHRNHMAHHGQTIGTCRICNRMFRTPLLFMNHLHCSFQCRGIATAPSYTPRGRGGARGASSQRMPSIQPTSPVMQRAPSTRGARGGGTASSLSMTQGLGLSQASSRIPPMSQPRASSGTRNPMTPQRRGRPPLNTYSPRQVQPMTVQHQQLQVQQRQQQQMLQSQMQRSPVRAMPTTPTQSQRRRQMQAPDPNDVIVLD